MKRRNFLQGSALFGCGLLLNAARASAADSRPLLEQGIQIGDVLSDSAIVWGRSDRPARMWVEWASREDFSNAVAVRGPWALPQGDFTSQVELVGLPAGERIFVRLGYRDAEDHTMSDWVNGSFMTAPLLAAPVRFLWSGDTAGQGFGINPEFGGMKIYRTMADQAPDFFVHSGDTIYADGPIPESIEVEDGKLWKNLVTPEVSKVAETLNEFRGRYRYNLLDENVRHFNSQVAQLWQWDDHEVVNNYSAAKDLSGDERYQVKSVGLLQARASRAFFDYAPLRQTGPQGSDRIYRALPFGPLLDRFMLDLRSYRGRNSANMQVAAGADTVLLGQDQLQWLLDELKASKATWKAVFCDMPLGLQVADGDNWEAVANGDNGEARGRELEIAWLLKEIKAAGIENVVWFTADVHYTAAHYYDPAKARQNDFSPFWEFVSGPLNAGSFGPNAQDDTFGLQVKYQKAPEKPNMSPFAGLQFFGQVDIDPKSRAMTVTLKDLENKSLFTQVLIPA
ncbi:alkaline phosphatase D family protein [Marinobacterium sedimentorum]|uniref:alkaline phosphatase D family protein n=1 Tax=Marinobacterium sedimentorum TaxID=2927804 RepID=UPI0020C727DC|nr:alkaline phosphatase D family protein [Marinobacterium sedimentorum]MCP8688050.1 alkaline phosphatase D family protein [Marinobacterium sedimentorum]